MNPIDTYLELPGVVQAAATLLACLVSVLATFFIYRKNIKAKRLTIAMSPINRMLDVNESVKGQIEIRFQGKPIQNLFAGGFTLQNSGNQPIKNLSVRVRSEPGTRILTFYPARPSFDCAEEAAKVKEVESGVDVSVGLLNRRERISFDCTWTGAPKFPLIDARQAGLDIIRRDVRIDVAVLTTAEAINLVLRHTLFRQL